MHLFMIIRVFVSFEDSEEDDDEEYPSLLSTMDKSALAGYMDGTSRSTLPMIEVDVYSSPCMFVHNIIVPINEVRQCYYNVWLIG